MSYTVEFKGARYRTLQTRTGDFVPHVQIPAMGEKWLRVNPGITYMTRNWAILHAEWAIEDHAIGKRIHVAELSHA